MDVEKYRLVDPFTIPSNPDELERLIGWFFARLRVIVSVENHRMKFHNVEQLLEILEEASLVEGVNVTIGWSDGQWDLLTADSKDDILKLPQLIKRFGRIYRHHARDYTNTGDKTDIKMLQGD